MIGFSWQSSRWTCNELMMCTQNHKSMLCHLCSQDGMLCTYTLPSIKSSYAIAYSRENKNPCSSGHGLMALCACCIRLTWSTHSHHMQFRWLPTVLGKKWPEGDNCMNSRYLNGTKRTEQSKQKGQLKTDRQWQKWDYPCAIQKCRIINIKGKRSVLDDLKCLRAETG
jgi:disulfide oxidoreductase YuzD